VAVGNSIFVLFQPDTEAPGINLGSAGPLLDGNIEESGAECRPHKRAVIIEPGDREVRDIGGQIALVNGEFITPGAEDAGSGPGERTALWALPLR
jgi:hypothetical protein